jgi:hypothetical protein
MQWLPCRRLVAERAKATAALRELSSTTASMAVKLSPVLAAAADPAQLSPQQLLEGQFEWAPQLSIALSSRVASRLLMRAMLAMAAHAFAWASVQCSAEP